nr:DeoR/GlpR family DNA-binding transcription regulator [uncultured Cetobacterium sp.]
MFVQERKNEILNLLKKREKISVNELSDIFGVSKVIIRKDLSNLEKDGFLCRTHGGAILKKNITNKLAIKNMEREQLQEKIEIANIAVSQIKDGDSIFLDASTFSLLIGTILQKKKLNLTIFTNMLKVQQILAENKNFNLISLGGIYDKESDSFYGDIPEEALKRFNIEKVFISPLGVNLETMNLSVTSTFQGGIKSLAKKYGKKTFILACNSNFYKDYLFNFSQIDNSTTIITSSNLDLEIKNIIMAKEISFLEK